MPPPDFKSPVSNKHTMNSENDPLKKQVGGAHYTKYEIQPIEYCEANQLGACESAIVKYITRWKEKGGYQDLDKIIHYIQLLKTTYDTYHGGDPHERK
jgi:hypothetical protein